MLIVLLGFQFYRDVTPVFTSDDSFMKSDYLIINKKIGMGSTISGRSNSFTQNEYEAIANQPFTNKAGKFTSTAYQVDARMGIAGTNILNSELFFESMRLLMLQRTIGNLRLAIMWFRLFFRELTLLCITLDLLKVVRCRRLAMDLSV